MKPNSSPDEKQRRAFFLAAELIWAGRDVPCCQRVIRRTMRVANVPRRIRLCTYCHRRYLKTEDPRIAHCSRACAQQHRRVNEQQEKEEYGHM